jgi:5-methylthioadenosine/S-adenosylhomocysteine deaminase
MRQLGINVGLGTDGAASNNRLDLFGEMRLASLLGQRPERRRQRPAGGEVLRMATLDALPTRSAWASKSAPSPPASWPTFVPSASANLECRPCYDPVSHLINVAGRESVTHVWVAGKCCVDNKTLRYDRQNDLEAAVALWQNSLEFRQRPA